MIRCLRYFLVLGEGKDVPLCSRYQESRLIVEKTDYEKVGSLVWIEFLVSPVPLAIDRRRRAQIYVLHPHEWKM